MEEDSEEITLKGNYLSAEELVEHTKKVKEFVLLPRGTKLTDPSEDPDSQRTKAYLENLHEFLSLERVLLSNKTAKGVYEFENRRVKVVKPAGRGCFGYIENKEQYLKPHEALFLMESGKISILFDTVMMSVEQAYAIFLDEANEVCLEEYLVYSYLLRCGFIVTLHDPDSDRLKIEKSQAISNINKEDEMIWHVLRENLNQPVSSKFVTENYELYCKTKKKMTDICEKISGEYEEQEEECSTSDNSNKDAGSSNKRPLSSCEDDPLENPCKEQKTSKEKSSDSNFLDILKREPEYKKYEEIFLKFSFIKRAEDLKSSEKKLKFKFDVFIPRADFKKTVDLPNYRILIIKSTDEFPTHAELEVLKKQQFYVLPIFIAIVSESMSIHFCSFEF
ncbi:CLUMA_CG015250, isoform A [Clunio marinus]|uniref:CLUMA_CG015250, isoform A n=1 Tax=Clunio marinus TaxID=568069 RepID=A0A1J1INX9_9DIPT|nr:CLUMA_CG015250, isoform A [Clunio marinus]